MTFVETTLHKMPQISKPRLSFLTSLFGALACFVGRATMVHLSRFGAGSPRRLSRWFDKPFDWWHLNWTALEHTDVADHPLCACIDCTFLPKSDTQTWGLASFHHGATGRAETGCEAFVLGLLDADEHTASSLQAWQTPASFPKHNQDLEEGEPFTRVDFYVECVRERLDALLARGIGHLVADGYFAKTKVLEALEGTGLHLISKLRCDANLRYLYTGPRKKGPGRPKLYDGKVDFENLSRFEQLDAPDKDVELYWADLNAPHFGRTLRVVVVRTRRAGKVRHQVLFTTDLEWEPVKVYVRYKLRFQQEFVFRDGKQFVGLADGQMRDQTKRHEHLNASLSALNLMRLEERQEHEDPEARVISMADWKRRTYAQHAAQRVFYHLNLDAEQLQSHPGYEALRREGFLAA